MTTNPTLSEEIKKILPVPEEAGKEEEQEDTTFEIKGKSFGEQFLKEVLQAYQENWNEHNQTHEIEYFTTVTNHRVPAPDGTNKYVAYLRIERAIREKNDTREDAWEPALVHQEIHFFKNMQERLNFKAPWVEEMCIKSIIRLMTAGLEYAEALQAYQKAKKKGEENLPEKEEKKLDLVITDQMPAPFTEKDKEYQEWVKNNNEHARTK